MWNIVAGITKYKRPPEYEKFLITMGTTIWDLILIKRISSLIYKFSLSIHLFSTTFVFEF